MIRGILATKRMINYGLGFGTTSGGITYLLHDKFTTDLPAGSVNGTLAEPTGGIRAVTDANLKLSIVGSQLSFATGGAINSGLVYSLQTRIAGKILVGTVNTKNANGMRFGFDDTGTGIFTERFVLDSNGFYATPLVGDCVFNTDYQIVGALRTNGMFWFVKNGTYTNWTLLYINSIGTGNVYPGIQNGSSTLAVFTADNIRIPTTLYLPSPIVSDGFSIQGVTDGLGHAEGIAGGLGSGGSGITVTGGTVGAGKLTITPSLGNEAVINGDMEGVYSSGKAPSWSKLGSPTLSETADSNTGLKAQGVTGSPNVNDSVYQTVSTIINTYYLFSCYAKKISGVQEANITLSNFFQKDILRTTSATYTNLMATGRATAITLNIFLHGRNIGDVNRFDTISLKSLTLSSLFGGLVQTADPDILIDVTTSLTSDTQAGLVTNLDSASNPANFLIAYLDGTNFHLDKCVAGVYTALINTAVAGVTNKVIRVITYHSGVNLKVRCYVDNTFVGAEQTISDLGIRTNTIHGCFSTFQNNSFDNLTIYARGSDNEYAELDKY